LPRLLELALTRLERAEREAVEAERFLRGSAKLKRQKANSLRKLVETLQAIIAANAKGRGNGT
jgi:hypothetical protein